METQRGEQVYVELQAGVEPHAYTPPQPPQIDARTRLPEHNLDVLRAIAVLLVLVDHVCESLGNHAPFIRWLGQAGVQAFFVHTSLVLMASLERDGAPDIPTWKRRFYLRRALRIYPLAWTVIAVVLLLHIPESLIPAGFQPASALTVLSNLALVQNLTGVDNVLTVLWTLPLEMQMYVALPFCYLVARKRSPAGMLLLVAASVVLASFYTFAVSAHRLRGVWRLDVFQYAPCFLMGVTAYWALRRQKTRRPLLPAWSWSFVVLGNVALWFLTWDAPWPVWIGRALFAASLGVAIPFVRDAASSMFTRVAHTVATYSYGVYLLHLLAIRAGFWLLRNQPPVVQCTTVIIVLVGSCYVSYHLIEKPGIALGQFLVRGRRSAMALEVTQVASVP